MQRLVKVDGKVRTDMFFPTGFMDVISIEKTKEQFRMLYNTKGKFCVHRISKDESTYKLCKVKTIKKGPKGIPYCVTHDGAPSSTQILTSRCMTQCGLISAVARSSITSNSKLETLQRCRLETVLAVSAQFRPVSVTQALSRSSTSRIVQGTAL